jgi:L-alanine-DL-glutamate epimerase-like enolase superfamily enzyme
VTVPSPATAPPSLTRLGIARIETTCIRVPLGRVFRGSKYEMSHRSTIVTRVYTDEGIVGEAYAGDEDAELAQIDGIIHREVAPQLIGEDALAIERCWELTRPATFNILRDRRVGLVACACVDTALWDAVGKATGQPLWRLWGGYRRSIPIVSVGGYYDSPVGVREEAEQLAAAGFAGMKFKVGGLTPEQDAERFKLARAGAGPDFAILADANQGWSPEQALRFVDLVADHDLHWFEEPCGWHNDRRAMRDVRLGGRVRVCAGQSEFTAGGCRDLMVDGAIDVCNFDASWSGGPTEWRRVAGMALAFDVRMAHHEEPQVGSHLLASIPHGTFMETFQRDRDPIWWGLVANRPAIVDGHVSLTDTPGFGWELDWDFVERHRVAFPESGPEGSRRTP